jgi:LPS-assembly lipoprotein
MAMVLAGCGFHPVYAPRQDGAAGPALQGLSEVNVPVISERSGQLLRQALEDRFERAGAGNAKLYDLVVGYSVNAEAGGYQRDNSVTRLRMSGQATWSLVSLGAERKTLAHGLARAADGYNLLDLQYFAGDLANEAAQKRIAEAVADQLTLQLSAYFNNNPPAR